MGHAGHDDLAHDHAGAPEPAGGHAGAAEIPPEPASRFISPAPQEFERAVRWRGFLWPVAWVLVAVGIWLAYRGHGWPDLRAH